MSYDTKPQADTNGDADSPAMKMWTVEAANDPHPAYGAVSADVLPGSSTGPGRRSMP